MNQKIDRLIWLKNFMIAKYNRMMDVSNISTYRGELMGFATLWVLCYHFAGDMGVSMLDYFSCIGYGGVDIFVFLSGFGLTVGFKKKSMLDFYKKRFLRVVPTYLVLIVIWYAFRPSYSVKDALIASTGIGFYIHGYHYWDWYLPFLYLLYLLFPLWMKLTNKALENKKIIKFSLFTLGASILGFLWSGYLIWGQRGPITILGATRVPIFFLGSLFGFIFLNKVYIEKKIYYSLATLSTIVLVALVVIVKQIEFRFLWINGIFWFPFILIVPGLVLFLGMIFVKTHNIINKILQFFGSISLEFYLIHCIGLYYLGLYGKQIVLHFPYLSCLVFICVVALISKVYQMGLNAFLKMKSK